VTNFVEGTDFSISGRNLTWISSNSPDSGQYYSIKYTAQFEYICFIPPQPRYEKGTPLSQHVLLRPRHAAYGH